MKKFISKITLIGLLCIFTTPLVTHASDFNPQEFTKTCISSNQKSSPVTVTNSTAAENINQILIKASLADINIVTADTDHITASLSTFDNGPTLIAKTTSGIYAISAVQEDSFDNNNSNFSYSPTLTLTLPNSYNKNLTINSNLGNVQWNKLNLNVVSIITTLGNVNGQELIANDFNAKKSLGNIKINSLKSKINGSDFNGKFSEEAFNLHFNNTNWNNSNNYRNNNCINSNSNNYFNDSDYNNCYNNDCNDCDCNYDDCDYENINYGNAITETENISIKDLENIDININAINTVIVQEDRKNIDIKLDTYEKGPKLKFSKNKTLSITSNSKTEINNVYATPTPPTLTIKIPQKYNKNLSLRNSVGKIAISDLNLNNLLLNSTVGSISFKNIKSNMTNINTSVASITGSNIDSKKIFINTNVGSISIDGLKGEVFGSAITSPVFISLKEITNNFTFQTQTGSLDICLDKKAQNANILAQTSTGKINCNVPLSSTIENTSSYLNSIIGQGDHNINLKSSTGSINIR